MIKFSKPYTPAEKVWAVFCKSSWTDGYTEYPGTKHIEVHKTQRGAAKRMQELETEYNRIKTGYDVYCNFFIEEIDLYND